MRGEVPSTGYLRNGSCCDNGQLSLTCRCNILLLASLNRGFISFMKCQVALNFNRVQSHRLSFFVAQTKTICDQLLIILGTVWEATHLPSSRFSLMWEVIINAGLGEGWVGSLDTNWFHLEIILPGQLFSSLNSVLSKNDQNKGSCSVFPFIYESFLISFRVYIIQEKIVDDTWIWFQLSLDKKKLELAMTQPLYLCTEPKAGIPIFCTENKWSRDRDI